MAAVTLCEYALDRCHHEFTYNFCQQLFQPLEASAIKMLLCKKISLLILLFVSGEDPGDKQ